MGVTGLWTVIQPCARPIKLETLNKKRLAVDASIWIYQFLKAVRDKEGNALRNSHLVGFFRRICKLLYFGIKPVFVFDGGALLLKRETIANRKKRREGRREDAVRTAGKLLATQMRRVVEEERDAGRRRDEEERGNGKGKGKQKEEEEEEEEVTNNPVYADEAFMTDRERRQNRQFKKKDAYHLPSLEVSLEEMGAPNDPRIMSREELAAYARQFQQGEDLNLYDFSNIDFDSPLFISLPATDRYNILNAARLRSRLRMGYSREQLDSMFPDRMAFSKFQIERVKERNDLTQRLMNINGMNSDGITTGQRVAGERNKEYVLVKDSAVEGGWALGVVSDQKHGGQIDKPIDVDDYGQVDVFPEEGSDDEEGFEDVPIEGVNRLPKLPFLQKGVFDRSLEQQSQIVPEDRLVFDDSQQVIDDEEDSLFVPGDGYEGEDPQIRKHHGVTRSLAGSRDSEDEALQRAIEMSLEHPQDDFLDDFSLNRNRTPSPPKEVAPDVAHESDDDEMDFATALAQSKKTEKRQHSPVRDHYNGPLPFKPLRIGRSSTKNEPISEHAVDQQANGFGEESSQSVKDGLPLPPWFSGERSNAEFVPDKEDDASIEKYRDRTMTPDYQFLRDHKSPDVIQPENSKEVIDLEAGTEDRHVSNNDAIPVTSNSTKQNGDTSAVPVANSFESIKPSIEPSTEPQEIAESRQTWKEDTSVDKNADTDALKDVSRAESSPTPQFEDVAMDIGGRVPEVVNETGSDNASILQAPVEEAPVDISQQEALIAEDGDMSDSEDEELMRQLAAEGEEHVRFAATLNPASHTQDAFDYEKELKQLRSQQQRDRRDADEVTQVMIAECQQLLTLFGLPYITAPMEAEAQCAELVSLGLVDGIVTDDSDVFLFGGTKIYKNMFNQSKYVECYLTSDMEKEYALHRRKLISFAHLLGSDYTEGIPGIGPVSALEILTEFSSLEEFRDWWTQFQTGMSALHDPEGRHSEFHKKFKKTASKIFLPPSFPDPRVDDAYFRPEVDSDPSPFQWGVPDLHGVRNFLMATIGWSQERTDEILIPVVRDINRRDQEGTQSNITNFYAGPQGAGAFAPRVRAEGKSRMEKAFSRLRRAADSNTNGIPQEEGNEEGTEENDDNSSPAARMQATKGKRKKRTTEARNDTNDRDAATATSQRRIRRRTKAS